MRKTLLIFLILTSSFVYAEEEKEEFPMGSEPKNTAVTIIDGTAIRGLALATAVAITIALLNHAAREGHHAH